MKYSETINVKLKTQIKPERLILSVSQNFLKGLVHFQLQKVRDNNLYFQELCVYNVQYEKI